MKSKTIEISKTGHGYDVHYRGHSLGVFERDVDGYYKYYPEFGPGYWPSHDLRRIADLLDDVNKYYEGFMGCSICE